jgi:hypothetical protein
MSLSFARHPELVEGELVILSLSKDELVVRHPELVEG